MFRLGTLAFVPGVVYRASAPDAEGTAGEGDIGRAAGGPRRAACMHEPDTHAQGAFSTSFGAETDKERRVRSSPSLFYPRSPSCVENLSTPLSSFMIPRDET